MVANNEKCETWRINSFRDLKSVPDKDYKVELIWQFVAIAFCGYTLSFYCFYLALTSAKWNTSIFGNSFIKKKK